MCGSTAGGNILCMTWRALGHTGTTNATTLTSTHCLHHARLWIVCVLQLCAQRHHQLRRKLNLLSEPSSRMSTDTDCCFLKVVGTGLASLMAGRSGDWTWVTCGGGDARQVLIVAKQ